MPQAAKKKKLRRTTAPTIKSPSCPGESIFIQHATIRCKQTRAYFDAYNSMTLATAKQINRRMGTVKWYRMNKDTLVATLVLHQLVGKIQTLFRDTVMANNYDDNEKACSKAKVCPISLIPMSDIPYRHRYRHLNTWFDRNTLAKHMSTTSDFINPVTRVEFLEEDILKIDPTLMQQYKKRKELRAILANDMAMVQSVETEMEEIFQTMVEAAEEIRSRREFTIVFGNLSEDFQECLGDFVKLDHDRSVLALKALSDVIRGDPNHPNVMSRKRELILRRFLSTSFPFRKTS